MTFSIAGRCPETGMVGAAVCSSSIAVGGRCPHVRAGVGAVVTQNVTDPALGPLALTSMAEGLSASGVIRLMLERQPFLGWRQLIIVPALGEPAVFSGEQALGLSGYVVSLHCAAAGNLLASRAVVAAMVEAFTSTRDHLAQRLVVALKAGLDAGGEGGPVHAAGLKVADRVSWPVVDLRVDWSDEPIAHLSELWERYRPQLHDYVTRAQSPPDAPAYGVPGESQGGP
jgi:uncharacterized Ntn-hydrolase superfamily protein